MNSPRTFDAEKFFAAVDARRRAEELSWIALAAKIWDLSRVLNERRNDHPVSPATLKKLSKGTSCQHALFVLRWLKVPPEDFVVEPVAGTTGVPLPVADESHRPRWDLKKLYAALDDARTARGATWQQAAFRLRTGLRTAKFATNMELAMRVTQALRRPAADFVYLAQW